MAEKTFFSTKKYIQHR